MLINKTKIKDVFVIQQEPRIDARGYFSRIFAREELRKKGIRFSIAHANRSLTKEKGVVRGMHYQIYPKQEDKIIHCIQGAIFDVALDIRKKSATYGQWVGKVLSGKNKTMLLVPRGFAHGFQTLEKNCLVEYFVTQYYAPEHERGIRWNDPCFNIDWPIKKAILSKKDRQWSLKNKK